MWSRLAYNAVLPALRVAARLMARFDDKLRDGLAGRRGFRKRWTVLAESDGERPVWIHVSSVGEFEQARPLITALAAGHPGIPVLLTFSSPSGYHFAVKRERVGEGSNLVLIDYLPEDTPRNMRACFDLARPRMLILVKFDLWPNLVWTARDRAVPTILVDATLSRASKRISGPGRAFYRPVYGAISRILAISDEDARRFRESVPAHRSISVAGDTRFDRVIERWNERSATRLSFEPGKRPVVIAGSTWPADESRLLTALARLLTANPDWCAIIAPHEPAADRVAALVRWAGRNGFTVHTTGGAGDPGARVGIIDTVGVLAEAYRLGTVAYVGGSFSTGVHSVLEPAIAGLPVLFGPRHRNSLEAIELASCGAGFPVRSAEDIEATISRLLAGGERLRDASDAARNYVESRTGATAKCMEVIAPLL